MKKKSKFIDLSHTIHDGLVTYKGLPPPIICDFWTREYSAVFYKKGTSFQIGKIEMVANTGTYIDCPFHRYKDGKDLSEISLQRMVDIPGIVIHVPFDETIVIDKLWFKNRNLKGKAVLICTGWSEKWNTNDYFYGHPYLTEEAALFLKQKGVWLVGIDSYNIDNSTGRTRPVHSILLKNEILIVEHLCNLNKLIDKDFLFTALPPKIFGMGSFPVRAVGRF